MVQAQALDTCHFLGSFSKIFGEIGIWMQKKIIAMLFNIWRTDYDFIMTSHKITFQKNSLENIMVCYDA